MTAKILCSRTTCVRAFEECCYKRHCFHRVQAAVRSIVAAALKDEYLPFANFNKDSSEVIPQNAKF
jgi:hypothetical protein